MAVSGYIGTGGGSLDFTAKRSLNVTLPANTYPSGTITFTNISSGNAYWRNNFTTTQTLDIYLVNADVTQWVKLFTLTIGGSSSDVTTRTATVNAPQLAGAQLYLYAEGTVNAKNAIVLRNQTSVTIDTASTSLSVTCSAGAGGTLSASALSATPGSTVTLYPSASTGYYLTGYTTSPAVTITNNQFVMPNSAISITANFAKISYTISKAASPSGGGTVTTSKNSATYGESITISQTPATGYYFNGWTTSPSLTISGGAFTMPASNVSITARYLKRSTGSLNKTSMAGGSTVTLTISSESTAYTHKYKLSFGTNMETGLVNVAAGVSSVTISVPESWSNQIPSAASKTGGTLTLETYSGSTKIGTYTISSLTYTVPTSAVPSIGTITTSIARTIGSKTYANVGNYYVQSHCGVRTQASASGSLSATISQMKLTISGYSGGSYSKTISSGSMDFTSGLLTISGSTIITVTATDTRGRTSSKTATITVSAYNNPAGSLKVWRVDAQGQDDDVGQYGKYQITKSYTAIGSNSLTVQLTASGSTVTITGTTGDILPGNRKTFNLQQEYTIKLTLTDAFETVVINQTLPSAKFIIYVSANGNKLGFMKAAQYGAASAETIEFSGNATIYIGNQTLAQYIQSVVNNM